MHSPEPYLAGTYYQLSLNVFLYLELSPIWVNNSYHHLKTLEGEQFHSFLKKFLGAQLPYSRKSISGEQLLIQKNCLSKLYWNHFLLSYAKIFGTYIILHICFIVFNTVLFCVCVLVSHFNRVKLFPIFHTLQCLLL